MQNKTMIIVLVVVLLFGGAVLFYKNRGEVTLLTGENEGIEYGPEADNAGESLLPDEPSKVATSTPPASVGSYTIAEVATHNSAQSCWTAISGSVYDVTEWINKHPGGSKAILSLCGTDGTAAFTGKHAGQAGPLEALAGFKIGVVK